MFNPKEDDSEERAYARAGQQILALQKEQDDYLIFLYKRFLRMREEDDSILDGPLTKFYLGVAYELEINRKLPLPTSPLPKLEKP